MGMCRFNLLNNRFSRSLSSQTREELHTGSSDCRSGIQEMWKAIKSLKIITFPGSHLCNKSCILCRIYFGWDDSKRETKLSSRGFIFLRHTPIILGCLCLYLSHTMDIKSLKDQHHQIQEYMGEVQKKITILNQYLDREKNISTTLKTLKERGAFKNYSHPEMATAIYEIATKHHIEIEGKNFRIYPDQIIFSNKETDVKETHIWILIRPNNPENMTAFIDELKQKYPVSITHSPENFSLRIVWYSVLLQSKN